MQILYHHIIRMIGNGIHVTNIFTGLGFDVHWPLEAPQRWQTNNRLQVWMYFQSTNLFLEQQLNCIPLHPGWDWNIFEFYRGSTINHHQTNYKSSQSHKASFCLEDTECLPGRRQKYDCKTEQAISPGCADIYVSGIDCQVSPNFNSPGTELSA